MYLTYFTYFIVVVLLIWGGKFAGFGKKFNDDFMSLEVTKSLRGFAAIGVLLHHISQEDPFRQAHELALFPDVGYMLVALFFFCSGYGLIKSYESKPDYLKTFLKKRVLSLVIPFYVMNVFYALRNVGLGWWRMPVGQWICNFLGITMMNGGAWFVIVMTILYLTFYFCFKNIKDRRISFAIIFGVIVLMGAAFCFIGHFAWWAGEPNWWLSDAGWSNSKWWMGQHTTWFHGEWWVNSSIGFLLGLLFANYEKKVLDWIKKAYWLKFVLILLLTLFAHGLTMFCQGKFGYWSEWNGSGPGIGNKAICLVSQVFHNSMFTILVFTGLMKYHVVNPVSKWMGNISLETYLMNYIPIYVFEFLIFNRSGPVFKAHNWNLAVYEVCVILFTILLAILFRWINKKILKKIG